MPFFGKSKLTQKKLEKIAQLPCPQCRQTQRLKYGINIDPTYLPIPHACETTVQPSTLSTLSAPAAAKIKNNGFRFVKETKLWVPQVKTE